MDNKVLAFRLENFMGFEDTGWLDLKPITLLFGRNSTGKSALIRALLLLRQSVDSEGKVNPLIFVDDNGTDVGTFRDFVKDGETSRDVGFHLKVELDEEATSNTRIEEIDGLDTERYKPIMMVKLGFGLVYSELTVTEIRLQVKPEALPYNENIDIKIDLYHAIWCRKSSKWTHSFNEGIQSRNSNENFLDEDLWQETIPVFGVGFFPRLHVNTTTEYFEESSPLDLKIINLSLRYLRQQTTKFLHTLTYIGPIRSEPQRFYYVSQNIKRDVGKYGQYSAQVYLGAEKSNIELVQKWITNIAPENQFDILQVPENPVHIITLQRNNNLKANLRDVGFGISQILPVIIQSLLAEPGSTVIIEQPELHLHPHAQAELADMFIEANKRGVRFIIETHSENLLLRLRRRVVNTAMNCNHLNIVFVNHKTKVLEHISVDSKGAFIEASNTFEQFFASSELASYVNACVMRLQAERAKIIRPVVYTEGKTDKMILKTAWQKLYKQVEMPFFIESCDSVGTLSTYLKHIRPENSHLAIGLFDNDAEGIKLYKNLSFDNVDKFKAKIATHKKVAAFLLPVPEGKKEYQEWENLCIEFYFSEKALVHLNFRYPDAIVQNHMKKQIKITKPELREITSGKKHFAEQIVPTLPEKEFEPFRLIFDRIKELIDYCNQYNEVREDKNIDS